MQDGRVQYDVHLNACFLFTRNKKKFLQILRNGFQKMIANNKNKILRLQNYTLVTGVESKILYCPHKHIIETHLDQSNRKQSTTISDQQHRIKQKRRRKRTTTNTTTNTNNDFTHQKKKKQQIGRVEMKSNAYTVLYTRAVRMIRHQ